MIDHTDLIHYLQTLRASNPEEARQVEEFLSRMIDRREAATRLTEITAQIDSTGDSEFVEDGLTVAERSQRHNRNYSAKSILARDFDPSCRMPSEGYCDLVRELHGLHLSNEDYWAKAMDEAAAHFDSAAV